MPEGCVSAGAPSIDTHPRESSDLVTTLWLAGRGVYRSVDVRRSELVSVTSGRISRCGDEMMRVMLYEEAQSMLWSKKWSWLKAWAMQIA
jgi:hypothetical protein